MNEQEIVVQSTTESMESKDVKIDRAYYIKGVTFLLLLIIVWFLLAYVYVSLHGVNIMQRLAQPAIPLDFDYIGGNPNPFAVGMEILYWSLVGVICETAYVSAQSMLNKDFMFQKSLVKYISTSLFATGIAHAVIFTLQIIKLTVAGVEIT